MAQLITATHRRFINPKDPLEQQIEALLDLIANPPENSRIITISPELADWILQNRNTNNRNRRPKKIKRFSEKMAAGEFLLTGDTIKFGKSGILLDGQNRLFGCIRAGVSFRTHVVFGIDDKVFVFLDTGAPRSNPDTFQIEGVANPKLASAATRWVMLLTNIDPDKGPDRGKSFENEDLLAHYKADIDRDVLDPIVARLRRIGSVVPQAQLAAVLYHGRRISARPTERMLNDIERNLLGGRKLRERVLKLRSQQKGRVHENLEVAMFIQVWNAYRAGTQVTAYTLNWNESKPFPVLGD
jgi:hypothetical protein